MKAEGRLKKMNTALRGKEVNYTLNLNGEQLLMNDFLGKEIKLSWRGNINCIGCDKKIKKTYSQGYCYDCLLSAPETSPCILRPELCRAHLGEGRDIEWEEKNHNQPHVVYLSLTGGVKVGVTRKTQIPTRWIDQGAVKAIRLMELPNRFEAGQMEVVLKDIFSDRTDWRKMLKGEIEDVDLEEEKWRVAEELPRELTGLFTEDDEVVEINYPVLEYPKKVKSVSFDKINIVKGKLIGLKGQYLIFEDGRVLNIRKHTGYHVSIEQT